MKRSLLLLTSAITLGALSGFLISDFSNLASRFPQAMAFLSPTTATQASTNKPTATTAFGRLLNATTAVVDRARATKAPATASLLLKEPVVVVHGNGRDMSTLPEGTAVSLVKNEGRFLRVQHDGYVVTVPRSVVVVGVARAN